MSGDQEPTTTPGPTIGETARRLGVSENAVRQRIKRATLKAAKVDGVWRVALPDRECDRQDRPSPGPQADQEATAAVAISPAARAQLAALRDEFVAPLVATIGALERELGRLEAEWDAAVERAEEAEERLRQAAGHDAPRTHWEAPRRTRPATPARRPWWRRVWWLRDRDDR